MLVNPGQGQRPAAAMLSSGWLLCISLLSLTIFLFDVVWWWTKPVSPYQGLDKQALLAKPVIIAIKSAHFFDDYDRTVDGCTFMGHAPLGCILRNAYFEPDIEADAVWFHIPHVEEPARRDARHQLTVGFSMEPAAYYSNLDNLRFMDSIDIEMSYRQCAHIKTGYVRDNEHGIQKLFADPVPFEDKLDAIAYVNSNCEAINGRNQIVESVMELNRVEVHAWGRCLQNKNVTDEFDKMKVLRQYKFCIAMENSNTPDYVTEKIWQAYEAGCVPIYYGAPNILDFVPSKESLIDYATIADPDRLLQVIEQLMHNKTAYMEMHAWRYKPLSAQLPGFRKHVASIGRQHSQCQLCEAVMQHRLGMRTFTRTHCLRNKTWLEAVKAGGSTWGPGSDTLLTLNRTYRWPSTGGWDPYKEAPVGQPRNRTK